MTKNYIAFFVVFYLFCEWANSQETPVLSFVIPTQNRIQNNQFMIHPSYSFTRENNTHINLFHRSQWTEFDDSPELYMLSYSGRHSERAGVGIGLYQQNLGVITSFGGIANYSYSINLNEDMALSLGFNLAYFSSGVNRSRTVTNQDDPAIASLRNQSILTLKPGLLFSWRKIDIGVYAENLVDYNFKTSKVVKDYSNKTYSTIIQYHHSFQAQSGIFDEGFMKIIARGRVNEIQDFKYGGALLVEYPKLGWIQTGVDDFFGVSIGLGIHFSRKLSLGYVFERVINEGLVNFGPTHEFSLNYTFKDRTNEEKSMPNYNKKPTVKKTVKKTSSNNIKKQNLLKESSSTDVDQTYFVEEETANENVSDFQTDISKYDKAIEDTEKYISSLKEKEQFEQEKLNKIKVLKQELAENQKRLIQIIEEEDANEPLDKKDFQERIDNLLKYVARLEKTINEKDCNCEKNLKTVKDSSINNNIVKEQNIAFKKNALKSKSKLSKAEQLNEKLNKTDKPIQFNLSDEEIKEYYSRMTMKKRETAEKGHFLQIENLEPGYYIVANVFSEPENATVFLKELRSKGLNAQSFVYPKNKYRYVFLQKHKTWKEALVAYYTNLDNTYFDKIWIMNINIK